MSIVIVIEMHEMARASMPSRSRSVDDGERARDRLVMIHDSSWLVPGFEVR